MNSRGVLYIIFPGYLSAESSEALLERSIASLKRWHSDLPYHVARLPEGSTLLDKAKMFDLSPFDDTLYLDIDTVVMGELTFGFTLMERFGLALSICECPWARRFKGLADQDDLIEWNTGVIFFRKSNNEIQDFFRRWKYHATVIPSSVRYNTADGPKEMACNDQASFAAAVWDAKLNPAALPMNWNFRASWQKTLFGNVKIWHHHDDPSESLEQWNAEQSKPGAIISCANLSD